MGLFLFASPRFSFVLSGLVPLVIATSAVGAGVVINEIYYDHPGVDAGWEYVELFNSGNRKLPLGGAQLEFHNGSGEGWSVLWTGAVSDSIAADGLFVVGGELVRPLPDAVVTLRLQNGPDAVRLVVPGSPDDRVGYGEPSEPAYVEGRPAPDVAAGKALGRMPDGRDTDDNAADFVEMAPNPGARNLPRVDAALTLLDGALAAAVPGGRAGFSFGVTGTGTTAIPAGAVVLSVWDSTGSAVEPVWERTNAEPIASGQTLRYDVMLPVSKGYHWFSAWVALAGDERPSNNRIVMLRRVGPSPIRISEVMSYPRDGCPQYVEVFNVDARPALLWRNYLRDRAHDFERVSTDSLVVPSGRYAVVTPDRDALLQCFPGARRVVEMEGAWPTLNRSGSGEADSVEFADRHGIPFDAVSIPPLAASDRGRSLTRINLLAHSGSAVWVLTDPARGGTPGAPDPRALTEPSAPGRITVSPSTFAPGSGETIQIAVHPASPDVRAVVSVYDVAGHRRRELGSAVAFPGVFVWDGRDDAGRVVAPGFYVLTCEYFHGGGRVNTEKVVVGCGRRER